MLIKNWDLHKIPEGAGIKKKHAVLCEWCFSELNARLQSRSFQSLPSAGAQHPGRALGRGEDAGGVVRKAVREPAHKGRPARFVCVPSEE